MSRTTKWHKVRRSRIHGNGVFAAKDIPAGTTIIEYLGERISSEQADARHPIDPEHPFHTFFFSIATGEIIDGGVNGNDARWINHSCEPNCEAQESDAGHIFIISLQPIFKGDELLFDYALVIDQRRTKRLKEQYLCLCGSALCRGTMLSLKRKKR